MAEKQFNSSRNPMGSNFPTLPAPTDFQDYAHAYFMPAKDIWKNTGRTIMGVYLGRIIWFFDSFPDAPLTLSWVRADRLGRPT